MGPTPAIAAALCRYRWYSRATFANVAEFIFVNSTGGTGACGSIVDTE
jgi:hypothetical protein